MELTEQDIKEAIGKVADRINHRRRTELLNILDGKSALYAYAKRMRELQVFNHGNKSKSMRKIASMPAEIDAFFTKLYGPDYYKERDFFDRFASEWKVVSDRTS